MRSSEFRDLLRKLFDGELLDFHSDSSVDPPPHAEGCNFWSAEVAALGAWRRVDVIEEDPACFLFPRRFHGVRGFRSAQFPLTHAGVPQTCFVGVAAFNCIDLLARGFHVSDVLNGHTRKKHGRFRTRHV